MTFGLWILDFGFWNSGQGFRIAQSPKSLDFGLWALDLGLWVMDFVLLRTLVLGYLNFRFFDFELWTLTFGLWILDLGFLEFRSRFPHSPKSKVLGLWALDLGLWVMDFVLLRTLELGCLNFRFSTLDFDLWMLDSGLCFLEFTPRFPHSPKSKVLSLWVMDFAFSVLSFGLWALGFGLYIVHLRVWIFGLCNWDSVLWALSFVCEF